MDDGQTPFIIIKRYTIHEEEHHGGAWKIAFADFMTAMMAFFLVLWIVNATDKNTKTIIARYFNPVRLEDPARAPKGLHAENPGSKTEGDLAGGAVADPGEGSEGKPPSAPVSARDAKAVTPSAKPVTPGAEPAAVADPAAPKATMAESELFRDPYASLNLIVGSQPQAPEAGVINAVGVNAGGSPSSDAFHDPFQSLPRVAAGNRDAAALSQTLPPALPAAPPSVANAPAQTGTASAEPSPAKGKPIGAEASALNNPPSAARLLNELKEKISRFANARPGPAIDVRATDEGLLISLTDQLTFSMFPVGSAEPQAEVVREMQVIAKSLQNRPGTVVVRGHTDKRPFKSPLYDNWRLSSARAQMAYYMLTRAGLPESRFERIEGYADRQLRDSNLPYDAKNRRIEILLREPKP